MVAGVLCFQSAKLSKAFDFNKESMRARQVIQNLELHYLTCSDVSRKLKSEWKKIPCSPILGHFFLVHDEIMSIGTASALVLCTKMQHFVR